MDKKKLVKNICLNLLNNLKNELGDKIKIVHGLTDGFLGSIGNDYFQNYGPVIPDFNEIIKIISNSKYGTMHEIKYDK